MRGLKPLFAAALLGLLSSGHAQTTQTVVDIPTRSGVTQHMIVLSPPDPKAAVSQMSVQIRNVLPSEIEAVRQLLAASGWKHRVGDPEHFRELLSRSP